MNWDTAKGNWTLFKGNMKLQWGKLTDDHLCKIAGRRDQFTGKIQPARKTGIKMIASLVMTRGIDTAST